MLRLFTLGHAAAKALKSSFVGRFSKGETELLQKYGDP